MRNSVIAAGLALILASGCVSTGRDFNAAWVSRIEKNKTTRTRIQSWFGYPYMTGVDDGDEAWTYNFTKVSASGQTLTKTLYVIFDDNGVVKSYTFSTSFPEEMSVLSE